jgi:pimeloyl-ACP methyl ester carboxylesterase
VPLSVDLPVQHFRGRDGAALAYRELGQGHPLVLLHGYYSTAAENWLRFGHANRLAAAGHRVILPDLRGHGDSAKPHSPDSYPPDVLADDGLALLEALGLTDYDLGGYSLGARTTVRMLVRGARPGRVILAGAGLGAITRGRERGAFYRHVLTHLGLFERGSPEWHAERFLASVDGDPVALLRVLDTAVDSAPAELARIDMPVLVVMGEADEPADARDLVAALAHARYAAIPGNHTTAASRHELADAMVDFLSAASSS